MLLLYSRQMMKAKRKIQECRVMMLARMFSAPLPQLLLRKLVPLLSPSVLLSDSVPNPSLITLEASFCR
jgi:hypothetical protein